jgi:TonB-linked SusC/RagA family outer membrane protein
MLQVSASVTTNGQNFDLQIKNQTLKEILKEIENKTTYRFFYNDVVMDLNKMVTLNLNNKNIQEVMDELLNGSEVSYKILNNNLVVIAPALELQQIKVSGTILAAKDGVPLPGVSVQEKGTNNGAISDVNGKYSLTVQGANAVLVFSFVGYTVEERTVGGQSVIDISLSEDVRQLDEIVVVGYGTSKRSDISGSVVSVSTEDMLKKAPTNILQGLKGQAAGVMISSQDGSPNESAAIRIRGVGTITGSADPLYVIDGVQLRTSNIMKDANGNDIQVGTNANFLNPSDIEKIEVLKDASATAIYGSAGANGVIMITTKKGTAGPTRITFTADYGVQTLPYKLDVGNVDQYAANIRQARLNDGGTLANQIWAAKYDGERNNIDWQKEMTRVSLKQQYGLSASGGTEKTQSTLSLSYLNNDGIVINTNYKRLSGRASIVSKLADFLELGSDINFVHTEYHGSNQKLGNNANLSSIRDWASTTPTMDYVDPVSGEIISPNVKNSNGTYGAPEQGDIGSNDGNLGNNIYAEQMENSQLNKNNQVILSAYANIKLFKGLTFKTIGSYNYSGNNNFNFWGNKKRYLETTVNLQPVYTEIPLYNYDARYFLSIYNGNSNDIALENYLTYNWKNDIHNVTVMAGNSISKSFGNESQANGNGFPADNLRDVTLTDDPANRTATGKYFLESHNLSYFGRLQYSLKDRYILTGTIRRDGSSNFGSTNRWGTFPSAAAAWRISEESFLKNSPTISNLKLRLGWGQTGNSGGATDKSILGLTSNSISYFFYPQNGIAGTSTQRRLANGFAPLLTDPNLKWETNEQTNAGIDIGLLKNNLNITVDYFIRTSKDLLINESIRPSSGYTTVYTNYGEIQNKGLEFSVNYKKQIDRDWSFGVTVTGSTLKNKVTKMYADLFSENTTATLDGSNTGAVGAPSGTHWNGHSITRVGYAVGSFWGYKVDGVFQTGEVAKYNADAQAKGHNFYQNPGTVDGDFRYKDISGPDGKPDGYINEQDMTVLGDGFPKLNYGLTLDASYKNWDISIYSYGVLGAKIYSYSASMLSNMFPSDHGFTPNVLNEVAKSAWTPQNNSTTMSRLSFLDLNYNMRGSDEWVKSGDFLKISTIQIGYNFDRKLLKPLHIDGIRVKVSVQNLFCISSYNKYGDPESGQGSVLFTGLDTGRYPNPRIFSVGFNLQF